MSTHTHAATNSGTYTLAQAKYLASKLITDMERCRHIYGQPSQSEIADYLSELTSLLHAKYLATYEFGFAIGEKRKVSWKYWARFGDLEGGSESPGSLYRRADIEGASWFNFVTYSDKWSDLSLEERHSFKLGLPFYRSSGEEKKDGSGYWKDDKTYSATGAIVSRKSFVPYS